MESVRGAYGHGRHIDPETALLTGEAAGQRVASEGKSASASSVQVWRGRTSRSPASAPDYYGRPAVNQPVWMWAVPLYFQVGGLSGTAAVLSAVLQSARREDLSGLRKASRWIAVGGAALGGALLTYDLGRPSRFLKMLRVVRPTSPMNLGSWTLAKAGGLLAASLLAESKTPLAPMGRAAGLAAGVMGIPLAGYTGVLLGNTAVPVWKAARNRLPVLLISSGAASLGDALELLPLKERERAVARRLGTVGKAAELASVVAVEQAAGRVPEVGAPLRSGKSGRMWRTAKGCVAAGLALSLLPGKRRWWKPAAAVLGGAGSLLLRFALFEAGKVSGGDPQATFRQQGRGGP